ncbi:Vps72/YL1 C-terminal [Trinorchestia longiramus]|nr:Vps72/YL1 C-terminal [Trinorchestia longiramus]
MAPYSENAAGSDDKTNALPPFRNPNFEHRSILSSKKKVWRGLKQIVALERSASWPQDAVLYGSLDAPPSFKPAKRYSDVSGLPAIYTDPMTKLRYANADEFARIRKLPMDLVSGLLELRKASSIVG